MRGYEILSGAVDLTHQFLRSFSIAVYVVIHLSAGYSEDSDYTSDLNFPVGGQGANSSASQFRTAANQLATPQRSLETSRENSYERDDHQVLIDDAKRIFSQDTIESSRCVLLNDLLYI